MNTKYADAGATRQGERRPMKTCNKCGAYIVLVPNQNNKWYAADCYPYAKGDNYYYIKASPHFKTCGTTQHMNTVQEARCKKEALIAEKNRHYHTLFTELTSNGITGDALTDAVANIWATLTERYADDLANLDTIINGG